MSKIVVFGATGYAGGNITRELLARGHEVHGVARKRPDSAPEGMSFSAGSLHDPQFVQDSVSTADVVVIALPGSADKEGGPRLVDAIPAVVDAARSAGARVGVVGGAGSLRSSEDGPLVMDLDSFPAPFRPEAASQNEVLQALREAPADLDWFYFSPAGNFGPHNPGERTGTFRLGRDVLVTDQNGVSEISGADYAIAFVDEIEQPAHSRGRFTAAY